MKKIKKIWKMMRITFSKKYAAKVANVYWQTTTITHGSMEKSEFDFYYKNLVEVLSPHKNDKILDFGGGNGEIAFRFKQSGFDIEHCDISKQMVENAQREYKLQSWLCSQLIESLNSREKYSIILFHNAFFYVHPSNWTSLLINLKKVLSKNGKIFITDTPDFSKRDKLGFSKLSMFVTKIFPVYQLELSGFFVKDKALQKLGKQLHFSVIKNDSWANYRSHWKLTKL